MSAGGVRNSCVWTQIPLDARDYLPTSHFRMATLRRLGAFQVQAGATCAHKYDVGGTTEECGHALDTNFTHSQLSNRGAAKLRTHNALGKAQMRLLREACAKVDDERFIPELMTWRGGDDGRRIATEAIMDIVAHWPCQSRPFWIDVAVRCPHAERYSIAKSRPGHAVGCGEQDKHIRYGSSVHTVAFETYGRIGFQSKQALDILALQAGACVGD